MTIYIASHKPYWAPKHPTYKLLHVGAANSAVSMPGLRDDSGDSLSCKNKNYCEITGLYWVWKNDNDSDIVGLCHYRRYLGFQYPFIRFVRKLTANKDCESYLEKIVDPSNIEQYLKNCDIMLPVPGKWKRNIEELYCFEHIPEDWETMKEVVKHLYPEYSDTMAQVFSRRWFYPCNMFVMRKSMFNDYMSWLYSILSEVEQRIIISSDPYQARVFGFMAERLFNLYIIHNKFKVKEFPMVFIDEQRSEFKCSFKNAKYLIRDLKNAFQ